MWSPSGCTGEATASCCPLCPGHQRICAPEEVGAGGAGTPVGVMLQLREPPGSDEPWAAAAAPVHGRAVGFSAALSMGAEPLIPPGLQGQTQAGGAGGESPCCCFRLVSCLSSVCVRSRLTAALGFGLQVETPLGPLTGQPCWQQHTGNGVFTLSKGPETSRAPGRFAKLLVEWSLLGGGWNVRGDKHKQQVPRWPESPRSPRAGAGKCVGGEGEGEGAEHSVS